MESLFGGFGVVNVKGWSCRGVAQLHNWVDGSVREKFLYRICKDCDVGGYLFCFIEFVLGNKVGQFVACSVFDWNCTCVVFLMSFDVCVCCVGVVLY